MSLDRNKSTPLYEQLRLILLDKIQLGDYPVGTLMPTEKELCDDYNISRITARKALEELSRMGLIERVQGKGTIVTDNKHRGNLMQVKGHKRAMEDQGHKPGGIILSQKLIPPNPNLLKLFGLPEESDQEFWHFRRLRFLDEEPMVIMNSFVRKEIGDKMLTTELDNASFFSLFEKITKRHVVDSRALISATVASPEVAKILKTHVGAPLIWYRAVNLLDGGIPIEVNYSLFLGEKIHFETTFYRANTLEDMEQEFFEQIANPNK